MQDLRKPESSKFQEIALDAVTNAVNLPNTTLDKLKDQGPQQGTLRSGERVEVRRSDWTVTEKSPKYSDEQTAQRAIGAAMNSAYMLLTPAQQESCVIRYSAERVTDIRYTAEDGQYRVRIYSPLGREVDIVGFDHRVGTPEQDAVSSLRQIKNRPEINAVPTGGILVSIQKVSSDNVGDASGTADETTTFMTYKIDAGHGSISAKGLAILVGDITNSISMELDQQPESIQTKVRYGAHLRTPRDGSEGEAREDEVLYAAFDTNKRVYDMQTLSSLDRININELWSDLGPNQESSIVEAEIEVNNDSWAIEQNTNLKKPERVAEIIAAFMGTSLDE